ncbi:hypothetical protein [Anaerocolumna chitinilytica]|uniref:hypothetical protein n=1 Tax=Anaerocolumna chitinilytica TaxID=1727145 RepID=UPI001A9BD5D1|nr:hypothetical protein [Anaerocolumna chitinilytica]
MKVRLMRRLERLLKKCRKLKEPGAGTAQEYNDNLRQLGYQLLELYIKGKISIEDDIIQIAAEADQLNISGFIKEAGKYFSYKKNNGENAKFSEAIASCLMDFYNIVVESDNGYHVSYYYYRGDNKPQGVPGALSDLILKLFGICYEYEIDIETVMTEKYELCKKNYLN